MSDPSTSGSHRDLIGCGANPPNPQWPGGARIAVNFVTVFACALTLERHPPAAAAIREFGQDFCCHGWRWIEHYKLSRD